MTDAVPPGPAAFGADDGAPDPALADLLAAFDAGSAGLAQVQPGLLGARLLVPVVVPPEGVQLPDDDGGCGDGVGSLAGVTLTGRDGRRAQPAFTGLPALRAWDPAARPMPHRAADVARALLADGMTTLLLDPAGPVRLVLEGGPLLALAEGRRWLPPPSDPDVAAAVRQALTGVHGLLGVRLRAGRACDLTVELTVPPDAGAEQVHALGQECARRLAGHRVVGERAPAGVDVAVVVADTP